MHAPVIRASAGKFTDINNLLAVHVDRGVFGLIARVKDQRHVNADMGGTDAGIFFDRCKKLVDKICSCHRE